MTNTTLIIPVFIPDTKTEWRMVKTKESSERVREFILNETKDWASDPYWDGQELSYIKHHKFNWITAVLALFCIPMLFFVIGIISDPLQRWIYDLGYWGQTFWDTWSFKETFLRDLVVIGIGSAGLSGILFKNEPRGFGIRIREGDKWTYIEFDITNGPAWSEEFLDNLQEKGLVKIQGRINDV